MAKLRDFHASYKSICDNFSMDLSEFEHIFGAGESAFVNWDTDNNGLIDSLEVFSGMCIFSNTKFDDKIRCIFYIYILFIFFITLINNNNNNKKKKSFIRSI